MHIKKKFSYIQFIYIRARATKNYNLRLQAFLAQCLDRVVQHIDKNSQEQKKVSELKVIMVHHFGKSLMYGCEYIYQTVPRMLSIWLDLGENVDTDEKSQALLKINKIIRKI